MPRNRLYEEVMQRLGAYIVEANLQVGGKLPPERELASRLGVSRASVSQAMVALEIQGVVDIRHGIGIYVRRTDAPLEPLARLLERRKRLPEILEAREALELKVSALAARRRTAADLRQMEAALHEMEIDIQAGGIGEDADEAFHHSVSVAAQNAVLARLIQSIAEAIRETRRAALAEPNRPAASLADHRGILEAIRSQDPDAAESAMRAHLQTLQDIRLLHWQPDEAD